MNQVINKIIFSIIQKKLDWYFSLKKVASKDKQVILVIAEFYQQMEKIFLHTQDLNAAHLKLEWWKEEIIRKNQSIITMYNLPIHLFTEIITTFQENLNPMVFEKFEDVTINIIRTAGAREVLIAHVLNKNEKINLENIYQFAICVEMIHHIQHLRDYARKGFFYFAKSEMQKMQVTVEDLQSFRTNDNIRQLLNFQAEKAERAFNNVRHLDEVYLRNLKLRAQLSLQTLQVIREAHFNVLENYIAVSPIRKWWQVVIR